MMRQRSLNWAAAILLLCGMVVALSVFGYDPGDAPGSLHPPREEPLNLLGIFGAWLAHSLISTLGIAVYVWLAAWFVFVVALLQPRRRRAWVFRFVGWLVAIPLLAWLVHHFELPLGLNPLVGPGGTLGEWLDEKSAKLPAPWSLGLMVSLSLGVVLLVVDLPKVRRRAPLQPSGREPVVSVCPPRAVVPGKKPAAATSAPEPSHTHLERPAIASDPPLPNIPIVHHQITVQPTPTADADAPVLQERIVALGISNGLHSERERFAGYELPPLHLLEDPKPLDASCQETQLRERAVLLEKTFADFGLTIKVKGISTGPVVTMFEVAPETGVRVAKVTALGDDLALHLRVPGVRMVAPLPGKNAIGIEIPNEQRAPVRLKEVILTSAAQIAKTRIPLFLGKDAEGRPLIGDLVDMPHLLIAGTTGTGKSVCLNAIILSTLMTRRPDEVRLILIDPKSVELECYSRMPHLMCPIITDMKKAEAVLAWAVDKMEERYDLLRRARVRSISAYNDLSPEEIIKRLHPADEEERKRIPERLSYIVIVIDEMADLMMQFKKEVEGYIIRLAQKSRAAGIHLVLATQKPTVDVITGLIKSNLPSRICFKVAQKSDSRVVLDVMGADKLLGKGDLLFMPPGTSDLIRAQGAFASDQEIQKVTDWLESDPCYEAELLQLKTREAREAEESGGDLSQRLKSRDKLYEQAVEVVIREGRGSVSLLQRSLGIGYGRAARLIDFMAEDGIVGGYKGQNAREVLYTPEQWAIAKCES